MAFALNRYCDFRRRFEEWITLTTQALTALRQTGDRPKEAGALNNLGSALQGVRRFDEAITAHTRDLDICRELGDRHGEGQALNNLGLALREVRRFDDAIDAHIFRETGDRHGEGTVHFSWAIAYNERWKTRQGAVIRAVDGAVHDKWSDGVGERCSCRRHRGEALEGPGSGVVR
jgi:tetratricopeptide (TPR) repeat protein